VLNRIFNAVIGDLHRVAMVLLNVAVSASGSRR
jgi:hypothetical protein